VNVVSTDPAGETRTYSAIVVAADGATILAQSTPAETVTITWQAGTTGGWSITVSASPGTHVNANTTVTLTAVANQADPNYKIEIRDLHNGYVYNQCVNSTTCTQDVPFTDIAGGTGCTNQGTGTCDYAAVVVPVGTNGPAVAEADISICWSCTFSLSVAGLSHAPTLANGGGRRLDNTVGKVVDRRRTPSPPAHRYKPPQSLVELPHF
jgi:hypothetical protein